MKYLILLIIIFALPLGGCGTQQGTPTAVIESDEPTVTLTAIPTDTPIPDSSPTPTTSTVPTATIVVASSPTPPPEETAPLPNLISGQPVTITQITMIDATNGWGIGHQLDSGDRILYTADGGNTWVDRTPPLSAPSEPQEMGQRGWGYFLDARTAWGIFLSPNAPPPIQSPVVWRTLDGGQTWEHSGSLSITGGEAYFTPENFSFINPLQGWLLVHVDASMSHDYSNLYSTSDGGITWQRLIDPYGEGLQALQNTNLAFADSQFGWVTKDNLAVMPGTFLEQTNDGGFTWENIFLPVPPEIDWFNEMIQCETVSPTFLEPGVGMVLVNCHTFNERIYNYVYHTADRGETWQSTLLPTPAQSLVFIDNLVGWALGRDLYQSTDGGLSWVKIKSVNWDGQFSFIDAQTGWAVARNDTAIALVTTQDGGNTWQQLTPVIR